MEIVPSWYARVRQELPPAIADRVLEQCGVVSGRQLSGAISRDTIRSKVQAGLWQRLHWGVYAVFSGPPDEAARHWAALLRCGTGAALSHDTAAYVHGFHDQYQSVENVHAMVPAERRVRGRYPGIIVHHAHRIDHTRHPVRQPPIILVEATVLDLVDVARTARSAAAWILSACQRRVTTPDRLAEHLVGRKKIRWRPMAEAMILDARDGVQSLLEERYLRKVERAHGLPRAQRQRRIAVARVIWIDADYDLYDVRIELDGRLGHEGDGAFRDRRRDNRGVVDGKATLRYGAAEVFGEPCTVAGEVARVLVASGWHDTPQRCGPGCGILRPWTR